MHRIARIRKRAMPVLFGVAVVLAMTACAAPTSPSRPAAQTATPPPPPTSPSPTAPGDFSQLAGTWNGDSRLTQVNAYGGTGCVAEEMRSQIGVARPFTLSISDAGFVKLTDLSMKFSLWHSATTPDRLSFTPSGYYWSDILVFRCSNGTEHRLTSACGGGIIGRLSGNEISGTWGDCLEDLADESIVELTATFTGRR